MDRQAITALYKRIDNPDSDNIGLTNVNSRLVMKYGPEAHLKINSKKEWGLAYLSEYQFKTAVFLT